MKSAKMPSDEIRELGQLVSAIEAANAYFLGQVQKQVNTALTLRNWIIGRYIIEYEQKGEDRAQYGRQLFKEISKTLKKIGLTSFGERNLYLCKDFYIAYPEILRTVSAKLHFTDNQSVGILQTVSAKLENATSGLSQKVFVSKYLINLPSEEQLKEIIEKEQEKAFK